VLIKQLVENRVLLLNTTLHHQRIKLYFPRLEQLNERVFVTFPPGFSATISEFKAAINI
jgi:hypothetical protein